MELDVINYSIIIPHKNAINLLQRCLNSIPKRVDVQVIVVDDNSDLSINDFEIISNQMKPNVEIYFNNEGKGAGSARNIGLKYAKGKWVIFADSDDFFTNDAFVYFDKYVNSSYDIVYFEPCSAYSDTLLPAERHLYYKKLIDEFEEDNIFTNEKLRYNFGVPWCKMILRNIIEINNILFDEIMFSNDIMFSLKIGYYAHSIYAVPKVVYCVTVTEGSLVNRHSKANLKCRFEVVLKQNAFLRSIGKSMYQKSIMHYLKLSLHYGFFTFFDFIIMAISAKSNFFIGYKYWLKNYFNSNKLARNNKRYIINE